MTEIYTLPINYGPNKGKQIMYAPLKKAARLIGTSLEAEAFVTETEQLQDYPIRHVSSDPKDFRTLMLLPNNKCNFHCDYCYSSKGRNSHEMSEGMLKKALEWFITPDRLPGEKLTLIIIGGGEPLLSWNIVKRSVELALELNKKREGDLYVSVITNCSIINEEIIDFLNRTGCGICASYDILEDVQSKHRGHYHEVTENINIYSGKGVDVGITTVVTEENINRMVEMVDVMHETIPLVKQVSFKPLVPNDSFTRFARKEYYKRFVENFFVAKAAADGYGIRLTCPYLNAVYVLQDRFCEGKCVLSADGIVTGCNFVSSSLEPRFQDFRIGNISATDCMIDRKRADRVFSYNNTIELCSDCPAKYHCAGGCYAESIYMSDEEKRVYCKAMLLFLTRYLELKTGSI